MELQKERLNISTILDRKTVIPINKTIPAESGPGHITGILKIKKGQKNHTHRTGIFQDCSMVQNVLFWRVR